MLNVNTDSHAAAYRTQGGPAAPLRAFVWEAFASSVVDLMFLIKIYINLLQTELWCLQRVFYEAVFRKKS